MKKEEFYFPSRDHESRIHAVRWVPEGNQPVLIVQIVHGMAEHIGRYEAFAEFLTDKNVLVTGEDHLGHGGSIDENQTAGYFCKQDPATVVVRDVHRLKKLTQKQYEGIPYIILGHSMGSFIVRNYLCRYGSGIDGAVIMGTGTQPGILLGFSKLLTKILSAVFGDRHISGFLDRCAFGKYNQRIIPRKTEMDWLTKDSRIVDLYEADPLCGFKFTVNGFFTLFELISRAQNKNNLKNIPKDIPVLMISGKEDPVGNYGKGVEFACEKLVKAGLSKVSLKLWDDDRHELLNETDRRQVMEYLWKWFQETVFPE